MTSATAPWLTGAGTSTKAGLGVTAVTACAVAPSARFHRPRLDRDTPAWRATSSAPNPPFVHRANTRARSSAPRCGRYGRVITNALSSFIPATLHPPDELAYAVEKLPLTIDTWTDDRRYYSGSGGGVQYIIPSSFRSLELVT
jgi:hypothetical protein